METGDRRREDTESKKKKHTRDARECQKESTRQRPEVMDQKPIRRLNYGRNNVQKVKRNLEGRWYTEISDNRLLLRAML